MRANESLLKETIPCFLDPLEDTNYLFLGSVIGDFIFSLISHFRAKGGYQRNVQLIQNVKQGI